MAAQLVQMITVVDKSGKAVNSSKHIIDVWKEAKAAYKERKAEVGASRCCVEQRNPRAIGTTSREDDRSHTSYREHPRPHRRRRHRSHEERGRSLGSSTTAPNSPTTIYASPNMGFLAKGEEQYAPTTPGIRRSFTDKDGGLQLTRAPPLPARSYTTPILPTIDMDLAYGDLPGSMSLTTRGQEEEMKGLVNTAKRLLEEADCLHHSATKTIAMLQTNPDTMAAVALTLAEISNIAKMMAPSALASMSKGAPAVFSLLASPQFLIAGGVAVGLTVVALGGYKIIKQIKSKQTNEDTGIDEMIEVNTDVSRIETWRRGIAEEQASAVGTSVDGEFITPQAVALSRLKLEETRRASGGSSKERKKHRSSRSGSDHPPRSSSRPSSKANTTSALDPSVATTKHSGSTVEAKERKEKNVKKPSPLRLMFK